MDNGALPALQSCAGKKVCLFENSCLQGSQAMKPANQPFAKISSLNSILET